MDGSLNKYISRVTLNDGVNTLVIPEPIGIQTAPISLIRDKEFRSVLEGFDSPLTFYQSAMRFINDARAVGPDVKITSLVEVSSDYGVTWETLFNGLLDVPNLIGITDPTAKEVQMSIAKDDIWSRFYNRKATDVNITSVEGADGGVVAPAALVTVPLSTQIARKQLLTKMWLTTDEDFVDQIFDFTATDSISMVTLPVTELNEIEDYNSYPNEAFDTAVFTVFPFITTKEPAKKIEFTIQIVLAEGSSYNNKISSRVDVTLKWGPTIIIGAFRPLPQSLTRTDLGTNGVDGRTVFNITFTFPDDLPTPSHYAASIFKGDLFFLTIGYDTGGGALVESDYIVPNDIYAEKSSIDVISHTTYPPTTTEACRLHDVADAIIKRVSGDNFHSDFLSAGCGKDFVNMLGLHLRGHTFAEKPLATNFSSFFKSASAVWNLGVGYELVTGVLKITIEEISHFFDNSSNSIELSNIEKISESYKLDSFYNGLQIGYSKWQLSSGGSLIDDPQTQHTYTTPLKYLGQKLQVMCDWIAASLLVELTRRAIEKPNETYDTDNDIFIIAVNEDNTPKLDYVSSTNLFDPETRYNKELTPGRNFLRWLNDFNVGEGQYIGRFFKFVSGLGNFLTSITIAPGDCAAAETVTENDDIEITAPVLHGVKVIKFECPLNWEQYKLIRDNKNKSIGVSQTSANHEAYFIDQVDFYLFNRKGIFTLFRVE